MFNFTVAQDIIIKKSFAGIIWLFSDLLSLGFQTKSDCLL